MCSKTIAVCIPAVGIFGSPDVPMSKCLSINDFGATSSELHFANPSAACPPFGGPPRHGDGCPRIAGVLGAMCAVADRPPLGSNSQTTSKFVFEPTARANAQTAMNHGLTTKTVCVTNQMNESALVDPDVSELRTVRVLRRLPRFCPSIANDTVLGATEDCPLSAAILG
jgi:hypothetical protein